MPALMQVVKIYLCSFCMPGVMGNVFKLNKMRIIIFILISILNLHTCLSQDMIFFKDGSTKVVKVKNVGATTINYKIYEVINSPLYEVQKSDVLSILYKYGFREFFNNKSDSVKTTQYDSSNSSTIYILYDYKMDKSNKFPLYFNGIYICTFTGVSYRLLEVL